mmetsp:Transcript_4991/g.16087  ORF Transcript_4991/g.16087 Transcript_4991/m.16087 type:complete len:258 (+) Transcript_4991:333-1106(+)
MPASGTARMESGWMTWPGLVLIRMARPSGWSTVNLQPQSASTRETSFSITRSAFLRLNTGWSFCCSTNTRSPGVMPGASSACSRKVIFCPWRMPFSTKTSMTLRSWATLRPLHVLHRSCARITRPSPWHASQGACDCEIMGPIWRMKTFMPRPLHSSQGRSAPALPPRPSHVEQITFRLMASLTVLPRHRSSSDTWRGCMTSLPRGLPPASRRRRPPPPNIISNRSAAPPAGAPPASTPSLPCSSYSLRFSSSPMTA